MKKQKGIIILIVTGMLLTGFSLSSEASAGTEEKGKLRAAEQTEKKTEEKPKIEPASGILLKYKPPLRGKPGKRVGGASRGVGDEKVYLATLTPDHAALTTSSQPSLFWFLSQPTSIRVEVAINDENSIDPVLEVMLDKPESKGIQRLRLSDYDLHLKPGIEYQWFISLVVDPEHRSKDVVDTGIIKHIEPSKELADRLSGASGIEVPAVYAEEGIWYDALSSLLDLMDANPGDSALKDQLSGLLEQGGLSNVVEYEKKNE